MDSRTTTPELGHRVRFGDHGVSSAASAEEWDRALARGVGVTPFHRWAWLAGQAELHGWRFEPLVVDRDGEVIGGFPLLLTRRTSLWVPAPSLFPYVGPVADDAHLSEVIGTVHEWCRHRRVLSTRLDFAPVRRPALRPALEQARCTWQQSATHVVPLPGRVDDVWTQLATSAREGVQVAKGAGVVTRRSRKSEVVELLPALLDDASGTHGLRSQYPADVGQWAWDRLTGTSCTVLMRTAFAGPRPVGLVIGVGEGRDMYLWTAGAFREFRDLHVDHLLHHDAITEAVDRGYRTFDLGSEPDPGAAQLKADLGALPTEFTAATMTTYRSQAALRQLRAQVSQHIPGQRG